MNQQRETNGQAYQGTAVQQQETELADVILKYLSEFPHAIDTLEGIAEWWVMREQVRGGVEALVRVLQMLIERGFIEEIGPGDNPRYRLRPDTLQGK